MSALSGALSSVTGAGISRTMRSRTSSTFSPVFAETRGAFEQSRPMTSSTSEATLSGSAAGRSILLITGTISRSWSSAKYVFASVCASIPCDASIMSTAPSQAARERETS